ncbi:MAG: hypothetical protein C0403_07815, partial [Desulfobacterium sp.]|nr:hypothetical protein [Desulfobacterium sp.]
MRFTNCIVIGCLAGLLVSFSWASDIVTDQKKPVEFQQSSYAHLKKRVGLTRFQNKSTFLDDRLVSVTDDTLAGVLTERGKGVVPVQNADPVFSGLRDRQPRRVSGVIDNMTLIKVGRASGLNAVATGTITGIRDFQEERGYWWFKEMMFFIEVHMHCSVYDTETGAKILDMTLSEKIDLPEAFYRKMKAKGYTASFAEIQEIIISLSRQMGEEICTRMEQELFKTFIKTIDGQQVVISSGSNAGIKTGDLFTIHDSGRVVTGKEEHQFFIAGPGTGIL